MGSLRVCRKTARKIFRCEIHQDAIGLTAAMMGLLVTVLRIKFCECVAAGRGKVTGEANDETARWIR